ncbi:hypothetical protein AVW11_03915 [Streptomyces amritsarensis]|uniref:Uncharacterized protein n=1 Tax=Streptomyces amritsarensis TaxID=681158 RepID=A0ABX3G8S2_9ACTN|nr:hypothetical protein [Streptomyces amritsarensis]OLZ72547.1 hypothetical protein AVW11_03915 [Streptomyces amritsarensis]
MSLNLIETPSEAEAAWAEHQVRQGIATRYFDALHRGDRDEAATVWLEAADYDEANAGLSSSLRDELDGTYHRSAA